jgi:hypothetical protein
MIIYAVRILKDNLWLTIRTYGTREEAELFARENLNNEITPWSVSEFDWNWEMSNMEGSK